MAALMTEKTLVFFDSECATCHAVVRFILRSKNRNRFRFIPLAELLKVKAQTLRDKRGRVISGNSLVVLRNGNLLQKSDAVHAIFQSLGGIYWSHQLLKCVPSTLKDFFYDLYAARRYRILGRANPAEVCKSPDPRLRSLFLPGVPDEFWAFEPRDSVFMEAEWLRLVFLNYEIPAEVLKPFLPKGTEFDLWDGKVLCSLVAFQMAQTEVLGLALPGHVDFPEVNLRFYVKRRDPETGEWRRGVVFVKELVPQPFIAFCARALYNEAYSSCPMKSSFRDGEWSYSWRKADSFELRVNLEGEARYFDQGTLPYFITEHYWGYVSSRRGATIEYQVEHPSWRLWDRFSYQLTGDLTKLYGHEIGSYLKEPISVTAAEGSAIRVMKPRKIN